MIGPFLLHQPAWQVGHGQWHRLSFPLSPSASLQPGFCNEKRAATKKAAKIWIFIQLVPKHDVTGLVILAKPSNQQISFRCGSFFVAGYSGCRIQAQTSELSCPFDNEIYPLFHRLIQYGVPCADLQFHLSVSIEPRCAIKEPLAALSKLIFHIIDRKHVPV